MLHLKTINITSKRKLMNLESTTNKSQLKKYITLEFIFCF